jgi:hypothetical protein
MTIRAAVFCETDAPPRVRGHRGVYEFETCPRAGEQIVLRYRGGKSDTFAVTRVTHEPAMPNEAELAREMEDKLGFAGRQAIWIYVRFLGDDPLSLRSI